MWLGCTDKYKMDTKLWYWLSGMSSRFWVSAVSCCCKCETRCNSMVCYEILCQGGCTLEQSSEVSLTVTAGYWFVPCIVTYPPTTYTHQIYISGIWSQEVEGSVSWRHHSSCKMNLPFTVLAFLLSFRTFSNDDKVPCPWWPLPLGRYLRAPQFSPRTWCNPFMSKLCLLPLIRWHL